MTAARMATAPVPPPIPSPSADLPTAEDPRRSAPRPPGRGPHAVQFVDDLPPEQPHATTDEIADFAQALREQPGRWAIYPLAAHWNHRTRINRCSDINRGRKHAPSALRVDFEAAIREDVMYVRYVGSQR